MAKSVKADSLKASIMSMLEDYGEDVESATQKAIDTTAKKTVSQLRRYTPDGAGFWNSWDRYLKGWMSSAESQKYAYKRIVHNKKYQLVHLLEKGHKDKHGNPHSKAFPHVSIAEDKAKGIFEKELKKEIENL